MIYSQQLTTVAVPGSAAGTGDTIVFVRRQGGSTGCEGASDEYRQLQGYLLAGGSIDVRLALPQPHPTHAGGS